MIAYCAQFAATGDPNRPGLPAWPAVAPGTKTPYVQGLNIGHGGIAPFDRTGAHNLALWDTLAGR